MEIDNKNEYGKSELLKRGEFVAAEPQSRKDEIVDDEYGFIVSGRLAPKYFSGLVIDGYVHYKELGKHYEDDMIKKCLKDRNLIFINFKMTPEQIIEEQIIEGNIKSSSREHMKELIESDMFMEIGLRNKIILGYQAEKKINYRLSRALKLMKEYGIFITIYDTSGNLLWPKKMSYEEVKKFVAEKNEKAESK